MAARNLANTILCLQLILVPFVIADAKSQYAPANMEKTNLRAATEKLGAPLALRYSLPTTLRNGEEFAVQLTISGSVAVQQLTLSWRSSDDEQLHMQADERRIELHADSPVSLTLRAWLSDPPDSDDEKTGGDADTSGVGYKAAVATNSNAYIYLQGKSVADGIESLQHFAIPVRTAPLKKRLQVRKSSAASRKSAAANGAELRIELPAQEQILPVNAR